MLDNPPKFYSAPKSGLSRLLSQVRILRHKINGMQVSNENYLGRIYVRRPSCIIIGTNCVFHDGGHLWPTDYEKAEPRIIIGSNNAFGRNVVIESHALVHI